MPTPITGNPTGVASPSLRPDPETVPQCTAPQDIVDGVNAVTVNQPFEALANEIAYLKAPTAGIPAAPNTLDSKYSQPLRTYKSAVGIIRTAKEHWGFDVGNAVQWDEQWDEPELQFINSNGNTNSRRWMFHSDGGGGSGGYLNSWPPQHTAGANNGHRLLGISSVGGGGRADIQMLLSKCTGVFTDDMVFEMFWPFLLPAVATTNCTFVMGFTTNFQPSNAINDGVYLYKSPTDGNWQFKSVSGGTSSPVVDTGIAASASGVLHRAGIVLVGANQSDDSTARAIAFIDGTPVGNITAHLPYTTGGAGAGLPVGMIFGVVATAGAASVELFIGPARYRQNMYAGNAYL